MADINLTLVELEDIFQALTLKIFNMDPSAEASQDFVRISWPLLGAPDWKPTEDKIFLKVSMSDDDYSKQFDTVYANKTTDTAVQSLCGTNVVSVTWTAYGPNSFDYMNKLKNGLMFPNSKSYLSQNNLYRITNTSVPARIPEAFNNKWWERSDFSAKFNMLVVIENEVNYFASAKVTMVSDK